MKNNVRHWREKNYLSQSELAQLVGVQAQTIGSIENARHKPRPSTCRKLAEVLGVPVDQLFEDDSDDEKHAA